MYPVVVSAAGKDEKVGMRKGGKTKKRLSGKPKNRIFLFHLNLAGREKTAPIMKQKATNPIAATSPSKIERNAEVSSETHIVRDMKTHTETLPTILAFEVSVVFPFVMPESKSCRHDYKRDTESISDNCHNMFNLIF